MSSVANSGVNEHGPLLCTEILPHLSSPLSSPLSREHSIERPGVGTPQLGCFPFPPLLVPAGKKQSTMSDFTRKASTFWWASKVYPPKGFKGNVTDCYHYLLCDLCYICCPFCIFIIISTGSDSRFLDSRFLICAWLHEQTCVSLDFWQWQCTSTSMALLSEGWRAPRGPKLRKKLIV